MQAIEMFAAFVRSADALERIANSLELIAAGAGENTISVSAADGTATVSAPDNKRKRRTKAEIEAEKNGTAQGATLPPEVAAALNSEPPVNLTAPAVQPPVVTAPPVVQPPVVQPPAVQPAVDPVLAQYAALPVEQQFGHLLNTFGPHNNVTYVRDALVNTATSFGLGLPFSDPADRNLPGAAYRALSNEQRLAIFSATVQAIAAVTAAQQPGL